MTRPNAGAVAERARAEEAARIAEAIRSLLLTKSGADLHGWLPSKDAVLDIARIILARGRP